jgi:hypothetical protein
VGRWPARARAVLRVIHQPLLQPGYPPVASGQEDGREHRRFSLVQLGCQPRRRWRGRDEVHGTRAALKRSSVVDRIHWGERRGGRRGWCSGKRGLQRRRVRHWCALLRYRQRDAVCDLHSRHGSAARCHARRRRHRKRCGVMEFVRVIRHAARPLWAETRRTRRCIVALSVRRRPFRDVGIARLKGMNIAASKFAVHYTQ